MSVHIAAGRGAIAESILLPGDPLRAKYVAENYLDSPVQYNEIRNMLGYTGTYKGVPISVQGTGMGMPSMGIYSWELMTQYGVRNLIRIGTAGGLQGDLNLRDLVVAVGACTDSSYGKEFLLSGTYSPIASWDLLSKAGRASEKLGIPFRAGNVVSSDFYYKVNKEWYVQWERMNVLAVEMETAALYINAAYNRCNALSILTISDSLITGEKTTAEERQTSFHDMMILALETATA